jgi:hypothetical protein
MRFSLFLAVIAVVGVAGPARAGFTILDYPGSNQTIAQSVSGGNVAGYYRDGTTYRGFLYDGTTYTTLDPTGSLETVARSVSGGNVAGYYQDGTGTHGFLYTPDAGPVTATPLPPTAVQLLLAAGTFGGAFGWRRRRTRG